MRTSDSHGTTIVAATSDEERNRLFIAPFIAGLVAGGCGVFVGHPFDTLKVRLQVGKSQFREKTHISSLRQLYRGIMPPLLTVGTVQSLNFRLFETFKNKLAETQLQLTSNDNGNLHRSYLTRVFLAGTAAGAVISLVTSPVGFVKVQQQVATRKSMVDCAVEVYKTTGALSFYRGFSMMFVMESFGRGVYLWTYEACKMCFGRLLRVFPTSSDDQSRPQNKRYDVIADPSTALVLLPKKSSYRDYIDEEEAAARMDVKIMSAAVAGCVSWFVIYPFDVIKAKLQSDRFSLQHKDVAHCIANTWQEGGLRGFYRGLGFTLVRAAPVAATVLPLYEFIKDSIEATV